MLENFKALVTLLVPRGKEVEFCVCVCGGWGGVVHLLIWYGDHLLWFVATHVLFHGVVVLCCLVCAWHVDKGARWRKFDSFGGRHSSSATREEEWVIKNLEFVLKEFLFIVTDGVSEFIIVLLATYPSSAFNILVGR